VSRPIDIAGKLPKRSPGSKLPPGRFALLLRSGQDAQTVIADLRSQLSPLNIEVEPLSTRALLIKFPDHLMTADPSVAFDLAHQLQDRFNLENAEPEIFTDLMPEPDPKRQGRREESVDDFPPGCWAPEDPDLDNKPDWALQAMRIREAWQFSSSTGCASHGLDIVVAQPDTGTTKHPELEGIASLPGYDFVVGQEGNADPLDYIGNPGHGTATASVLISASSRKVTGVAPKARHMSIRAIESVIRVSQLSVSGAIEFAVDNGAHVITMSLGGLPSVFLWLALRRAVQNNLIVLAAAGNCVGEVVFPARYENCIAVAGVNVKDEPWKGTCCGPDVAVSAPGENVYRASVKRDEATGLVTFGVGQGQGTSFAVALTAGVAALWLAHHGREDLIKFADSKGETLQALFRRLLRATARRPGPNWDSTAMGAGIVDANALLRADLSTGLDREGFGLEAAGDATDAIRRLVLGFTRSPDAAQAPIDWERFGPEVAYALFARARGIAPFSRDAKVAPEAAQALAHPALSPQLEAALSSAPDLARQLGR
jgi:subtilisin family serine protease